MCEIKSERQKLGRKCWSSFSWIHSWIIVVLQWGTEQLNVVLRLGSPFGKPLRKTMINHRQIIIRMMIKIKVNRILFYFIAIVYFGGPICWKYKILINPLSAWLGLRRQSNEGFIFLDCFAVLDINKQGHVQPTRKQKSRVGWGKQAFFGSRLLYRVLSLSGFSTAQLMEQVGLLSFEIA